jgi:hypothetical protein
LQPISNKAVATSYVKKKPVRGKIFNGLDYAVISVLEPKTIILDLETKCVAFIGIRDIGLMLGKKQCFPLY